MKWRKVSSGAFVNIEYETKESGGEFFHIIRPSGPIGRDERIPAFEATLEITDSENYFSIVDNRKGYENILSLEDISFFGDMIYAAGIRRFFSVSVTDDAAYHKMVKLMNVVGGTKDIETETLSTRDYKEAEKFILDRMKKYMKNG